MNQKVSRNGKQKSSNEEKLVLGEYESTSIAQEDDSNSFELLQNLWINNLRFIILKCSRFCFYFTVYTNVLNIVVFMVRKGKEKQSKGQPPPPGLLVFYIFFQLPLLFHTPRLLETLEQLESFLPVMIILRFSGFSEFIWQNNFDQFWILLTSFSSLRFLREQCKQKMFLISCVTIQRHNGRNVEDIILYQLYFVQSISKTQEKETCTNFVLFLLMKYDLAIHELICIDQSRFYKFSHAWEFKVYFILTSQLSKSCI